jgi:hypothetical protein
MQEKGFLTAVELGVSSLFILVVEVFDIIVGTILLPFGMVALLFDSTTP